MSWLLGGTQCAGTFNMFVLGDYEEVTVTIKLVVPILRRTGCDVITKITSFRLLS
jgi:hypothetical protein